VPTVTLVDLLAQQWGLHGASATPLGGGMNSRTWLVQHGGNTYVAKEVTARDLPSLTNGCAVASRLADAGLRTGRPVPTTDGSLVVPRPATALLEHVPGRELDGSTAEEQRWMADTLAAVHAAGDRTTGPPTREFFDWLAPDAPGVELQPWLASAIDEVRSQVDALRLTWSVLHTDPAPEAFLREDSTGVTGLIDWTGAQRGPVLYDVASAVMYLGGTESAAAFLSAYRAHGILGDDEAQHLDALRRFRWAVQGAYFARRIVEADLTGVPGQADNHRGLGDARSGLAELSLSRTSEP
jgi:Ser/Thr protein kinase RdoA (MazF antagonist)